MPAYNNTFPFPVNSGGWGNEGVTEQKFNRFNNLESIEDRIIFYLLSPIGKSDEQIVQVHNLWKCLYYPNTDALLHGYDLEVNGITSIKPATGSHPSFCNFPCIYPDCREKDCPDYSNCLRNTGYTYANEHNKPRTIIVNEDCDFEEVDNNTNFKEVDELTFFREGIIPLISNGQAGQDKKRVFRSPYMDDAWKEECSFLKVYVDSVIPMNAYLSQVNIGIDCVCHNKIINLTVPEKDESTFIAEVDGVKYYVETKSRISVMTKAVLSLLNGANIQGVGQMQFNYENFMYNEARYALWNNRNFEGMKVVIGCQVGGVG